MAAAHSPLSVEQESDMSTIPQIGAPPEAPSTTVSKRKHMNLVLLVMLISLAIFPFLVRLLPAAVVQHLDVLFQ
jgi:hypothetical protein